MAKPKTRVGFILIIVMGLLGVLGLVAISFSAHAQVNRKLSINHVIQTKARLLALSGTQTATAHSQTKFDNISTTLNLKIEPNSSVVLKIEENSGKININDGIQAGRLELGATYDPQAINPWPGGESPGPIIASGNQLRERPPPSGAICKIFGINLASMATAGDILTIESGPNAGKSYTLTSAPTPSPGGCFIYTDSTELTNSGTMYSWSLRSSSVLNVSENSSGWINLRLRRLLNAYGDALRFAADLGWPSWKQNYVDPFTGQPFGFTSTDCGPRNFPLPARDSLGQPITDPQLVSLQSTGLGDRIIATRPIKGFRNPDKIKEIFNNWASEYVTADTLDGVPLLDIAMRDLTTNSYHDEDFFRIQREPGPYTNSPHPTYSELRIFNPLYPLFDPVYCDSDPFDMDNLFNRHPVAIINLNAASTLVRAATFFAPANVSYLCEGTRTETTTGISSSLTNIYSLQFLNQRDSLGVSGPIISQSRFRENNYPNDPINSPPAEKYFQPERFMGLRDAICLAKAWEEYPAVSGKNNPINYEEFSGFLTWYEANGREYERYLAKGTPYNSEYKILNELTTEGSFPQNCVSKTLPHILSTTRRLPGFLGAPAALTTPYLQKSGTGRRDFFDGSNSVHKGLSPRYLIEDFVFRSHLPKIDFLPGEWIRCESIGQFSKGDKTATHRVKCDIRTTQITHLKSQRQFENHYVASDNKILIGPEMGSQTSHEFIGFVGLKDRESDKIPNTQFSLQFSDDNFDSGFTNSATAETYFEPSHIELDPTINDPFTSSLVAGSTSHKFNVDMRTALTGSFPNDGDRPSISKGGSLPDVSPFGGFRALSLGHGPYAQTDPDKGIGSDRFNSSLYWSLLDNVNPDSSVQFHPENGFSHTEFGRGLVDLWIRIPTGHMAPMREPNSPELQRKFLRVCWQIKLFDRYSWHISLSDPIYLPVLITLGVSWNQQTQNYEIVAMYSEGRPSYGIGGNAAVQECFQRYRDHLYAGFQPLNPVPFDNDELNLPSYANSRKFLGLARTDGSKYKDGYPDPPSRRRAKILTRVISLKQTPENGPGSWHRVTLGWDIGFSNLVPNSDNALWLKLRDLSNVESSSNHDYDGEHPWLSGFGYYKNQADQCPVPHMIMLLGENWLGDIDGSQTNSGHRFGSCIDNFQASIGNVHTDYLGPNAIVYGNPNFTNDKTLRYDVDSNPSIEIDLGITGTRLFHARARVYRPPDEKDNYPSCDISFLNYQNGGTNLVPDYWSDNEQDAFFDNFYVKKSVSIKATWANHRPILDGNPTTFAPLINDATDNWTEIPWLKEIVVRSTPQGGVRFLNWNEQ